MRPWILCLAALLAVVGSGRDVRAQNVDQTNLPVVWAGLSAPIGNVAGHIITGQTFQPGVATLSGIDLDILTVNPGRGDDTITVQVLLHGQLVGTASQVVTDGFAGLLHFDLPSPVDVQVGQTYTLWVYDTSDLQTFAWKYGDNTYARGTAIFLDHGDVHTDFRFQTYSSTSAGPGVFAWHGPTMTIATGVSGNPSFVQATPGTYGAKGNYELVVPLASGGIACFERNNDDPNLPWSGPVTFATDQGTVDAVSIIQSNFSTQFLNTGAQGPGNLAVVARIGDQLVYYYRDDVSFQWSGPVLITTGVSGVPSFIQARPGTYGTVGNFELIVPLASGGIAYFERNNDDPNLPWSGPVTFATDQGTVDAVSIVQTNFSTGLVNTGTQGPGNLAVAASIGGNLVYFYRDDVDPFAWNGPTMTIATGVTGNPSFVQALPGTYGAMGNYELVVPLQSGGIAHFQRNNDDPSLPWTQTDTFGTSLGVVNGVSLIQSNFSTAGNGPGNLAVVSVANNELDYFYRDDQ